MHRAFDHMPQSDERASSTVEARPSEALRTLARLLARQAAREVTHQADEEVT
jgi:hypothetical protein